MKRKNRVDLELGEVTWVAAGIRYTRPEAIVVIESENKELLERLVGALTQVEDLEVE